MSEFWAASDKKRFNVWVWS